MSAYDITGYLGIAYRPFAYCVPSKHPLISAYQKGMSLSYIDIKEVIQVYCIGETTARFNKTFSVYVDRYYPYKNFVRAQMENKRPDGGLEIP